MFDPTEFYNSSVVTKKLGKQVLATFNWKKYIQRLSVLEISDWIKEKVVNEEEKMFCDFS